MRLIALLALLVVTACSVPVVRETLPNFNGKNVDYAISWLGVPDRQYNINGDTIYAWDNNMSHSYARPRANMTFGLGHGGYGRGWGSGVGVGVPFGDYEVETYTQRCEIKLITRKGIVQGSEFYGDDNGCAKYAARLRPLRDQMQAR